MKLVSQLAYVYELRNFPEYGDSTEKLLKTLRKEWAEGEEGPKRVTLHEALDETLAHLQRGRSSHQGSSTSLMHHK